VLGLTCGLAAAGGLPGPAQREAARVAGAVGWKIPDQFGSSSPSRSNHPDPGGHPNDASTTSTPTKPAVDRQRGSVPPGSRGAGGSDSAPGSSGSTPPTTKRTGPPAATAPGQSSPGKSGAAPGPGSTGSTPADPGKSADAPGHSGSTPGASSSAPGRSGASPGTSGEAPGTSGEAPGHTKDQGDG
jgi:integrin beta 8